MGRQDLIEFYKRPYRDSNYWKKTEATIFNFEFENEKTKLWKGITSSPLVSEIQRMTNPASEFVKASNTVSSPAGTNYHEASLPTIQDITFDDDLSVPLRKSIATGYLASSAITKEEVWKVYFDKLFEFEPDNEVFVARFVLPSDYNFADMEKCKREKQRADKLFNDIRRVFPYRFMMDELLWNVFDDLVSAQVKELRGGKELSSDYFPEMAVSFKIEDFMTQKSGQQRGVKVTIANNRAGHQSAKTDFKKKHNYAFFGGKGEGLGGVKVFTEAFDLPYSWEMSDRENTVTVKIPFKNLSPDPSVQTTSSPVMSQVPREKLASARSGLIKEGLISKGYPGLLVLTSSSPASSIVPSQIYSQDILERRLEQLKRILRARGYPVDTERQLSESL